MMRTYPLLAVFLACPGWLTAADFLGAEAVLKKVGEQAGMEQPKKEVSPVEALSEKVKSYRHQAAALSDEEAASQWLALLDGFLLIPQELLYESDNATRLNLGHLMEALPPARTWDVLAAAIGKRPKDKHPLREQALVLLAAVLRDDVAGRKQSVAALRDLVSKSQKIESYEREYFEQMVDRIGQRLDTAAGEGDAQIAALNKLMDGYEAKPADRSGNIIDIPDLLREVDEATAAPLIKRALSQDVAVHVSGKQTRRLASRLALENLGDLKKPVWGLIETEADLPLYEGLAKKFENDKNSSERSQADTVYLLHLIAAGRTEEAAKLTLELAETGEERGLSISSSDIEAMQKQGFGQQMLSFLTRMLQQQPTLPLWEPFIQLSAKHGKSDAAVALLRETIAGQDLKGEAREEVGTHLAAALLAADQAEEGLKVLREMVQKGPETASSGAAAGDEPDPLAKLGMTLTPEQRSRMQTMSNRDKMSPESLQISRALKLARLGRLLEKPEVVDEAVTAVLTAYGRLPRQDYGRTSEMSGVIELLVSTNHSDRAELLLMDELAFYARPDPQRRGRMSRPVREIMAALMWVYHKAGRAADVVHLLNHSPYWKVKDLESLSGQSFKEPVLFMAAQALSDVGQKEEARRIIQRAVQKLPSQDKLYALLLSLGGEGIEARLDSLQAANRFEERPLIWKAQLQLNQGRVQEAESTVRAAIAIDPSDGEQGKGDRMRAYAVLADILERKGDISQAIVMRGAVKAIRISEDADDWWNAGLLSRAVTMYEGALLHFADAYCIQSRLALRYSEMGDFAKAEIHYQRAFELMPDSFGRVESHCFGCEGAFKGKRAQNIADKVFTQLATKMPEKAQVFYLLGYLRDQEGLYAEAADHYRRAVKLDPDYLNAWKKLLATADEVRMPKAEREQVVLALFRLNPESGSDMTSLTNLRLFWDAILAAEAAWIKPETGLIYPMAASAEAVAKDPDAMREVEYMERHSSEDSGYRQYLMQHPLIQETGQVLQTTAQRGL